MRLEAFHAEAAPHSEPPECAASEPRNLASPAGPRQAEAAMPAREYGDLQLQLRTGNGAEAEQVAVQSSSISRLSSQMQELTQAFSMAVAIGSTSQEKLNRKMQKVFDDFLLPGARPLTISWTQLRS